MDWGGGFPNSSPTLSRVWPNGHGCTPSSVKSGRLHHTRAHVVPYGNAHSNIFCRHVSSFFKCPKSIPYCPPRLHLTYTSNRAPSRVIVCAIVGPLRCLASMRTFHFRRVFCRLLIASPSNCHVALPRRPATSPCHVALPRRPPIYLFESSYI